MKTIYWTGSLCCILLVTQTVSRAQGQRAKKEGQQVRKDSVDEKKSHWQAGVSYLSNAVYLGRKDSVSVPYITPTFGYHDKSGFFITGSLSYLPVSGENRIDLITLEAGYSYASDDLTAGISAAKDFYSDQSFAVGSEIMGRVSASVSYDLGFIEPSLDLGANFSSTPDLGLGLGLSHSFTLIENKVEIDPAFRLNIGTQNYYDNYYKKRRYGPNRKGKKPGSPSSTVTASVENASKFQVMDYEWEIPVEYTLKKFKFNFTPTLALPVNPAIISTVTKSSGGANSTQMTRESLSNTFYFSVGMNYSF